MSAQLVLRIQFNSIQFNVIYIAPKQYNRLSAL